MKQFNIPFVKSVILYYLICIVCTLIVSVFYYLKIVNFEILQYIGYGCGVIAMLVSCFYLCKKTEKKTLIQISIFLSILFTTSFLLNQWSWMLLLKISIALLFSFILILHR